MISKFTPWQRGFIAAAILVTLVLMTFGITRAVSVPAYPDNASADAGFARDMQVHHGQAVEMSMIARDRSSNPQIRSMAYDIALTQQHQIGQMHSWLEQWGLPQSPGIPAMAWMQHGGNEQMEGGVSAAGQMPGMASEQELAQLRAASGEEGDRLYLSLMIDHHRAGIAMAEAAVQLASTDRVRTFAEKSITAQAAEISTMEELLGAL